MAVPTNRQNVTLRDSDGFCSFNNVAVAMSKSDALDFAAWLVGLGNREGGCLKFLFALSGTAEGDHTPLVDNEYAVELSGEDVLISRPPTDDTFLLPGTVQKLAVWLVYFASSAPAKDRIRRNLAFIPDFSSRLEEVCSDSTVAGKRADGISK